MKYRIWTPETGCAEIERYQALLHNMQLNGRCLYVGRLPERAAHLFPDRIALQDQIRQMSFRQLYDEVMLCAAALRKKGIVRDDRVLLLYQNSIEFFIAYYAVLYLGAIVAPLNVFLTARELQHIVADAQPKALLVGSQQDVLCTQGLDCPVWQHANLQDIVGNVHPESFVLVDKDPEQLAVLLYTSGTTGLPKGVMLSSKNIMTNLAQALCRLVLHTDGSDRILAVLPLFHSFAQITAVWVSLYIGCGIIVVPKIDRRNIMDALALKPTLFVGVPALYGLLCIMRTAPIEQVRYFLCGGDALPDKIRMAFALLYGRKIIAGYGLTEASPLVSFEVTSRHTASNNIGVPVAGLAVEIRDDWGRLCELGSVGELWVKGNNVMLGYYADLEQTKTVMHNGWLKTGDLASIESDGMIYIAGRSKDLIIHKGFNIYPAEIENLLISHPLVLNAAIVGLETEQGDQVPVAFVHIKQESKTIEQELINMCKRDLAFYKAPRNYYISTHSLPLTSTKKIDKKALLSCLKK